MKEVTLPFELFLSRLHCTQLFSSTWTKIYIPSTDHVRVSEDHEYRIRSLSLAFASYHKDHFIQKPSTSNLCPSTTLFGQLPYESNREERSSYSHLIPFSLPQVFNISRQTCFISLLHLPAFGLQDASLQVVFQTEGESKNATQPQPGWTKMGI